MHTDGRVRSDRPVLRPVTPSRAVLAVSTAERSRPGHRRQTREADVDAHAPDLNGRPKRSLPRDRNAIRRPIGRRCVGQRPSRERRLAARTGVFDVSIPQLPYPVAVDGAGVVALPAEQGRLSARWRPFVGGGCGTSHRRPLRSRSTKPPTTVVARPSSIRTISIETAPPFGSESAGVGGRCRVRWVRPTTGSSDRSPVRFR